MFRTKCLICGSINLNEIINLGMHPFADTFVPKDRISEADKAYPLICDLCQECGQIQLRCETNPMDRYCQVDYSYTSSNSNFSRTHWINFAREVSDKIGLKKDSFIVEVGSNDGFLTEQFASNGNRVLGVDPSDYMARLAKNRNVDTVVGLFDSKIADEILKKHGKADIIIANNVFNHSNSPLDFAKAVKKLLSDDGTFVYELPYWYIGFKTGKFDQIYHEHVSYFTARSSKKILEIAGMGIRDLDVVDYHGGSLRVYAKHEDRVESAECSQLEETINKEFSEGLFDLNGYKRFMEDIIKQRNNFLQKVYEIRRRNIPIVAVGAAAKGNTFLNFYNLTNTILDYVTDSSPHKQGKYTPLSRIPIVGDEIFAKYNGEVCALILSWNIANQIKDGLAKINPNIKFIVPE